MNSGCLRHSRGIFPFTNGFITQCCHSTQLWHMEISSLHVFLPLHPQQKGLPNARWNLFTSGMSVLEWSFQAAKSPHGVLCEQITQCFSTSSSIYPLGNLFLAIRSLKKTWYYECSTDPCVFYEWHVCVQCRKKQASHSNLLPSDCYTTCTKNA